jgi:hypothetical protein
MQRAVLAEKADAPLTQWDATVATLRALAARTLSAFCSTNQPTAGILPAVMKTPQLNARFLRLPDG